MSSALVDNNEYGEVHVGHINCDKCAGPLIQVFNHPKIDCPELDELKNYQQRRAFVVIFDTSKRGMEKLLAWEDECPIPAGSKETAESAGWSAFRPGDVLFCRPKAYAHKRDYPAAMDEPIFYVVDRYVCFDCLIFFYLIFDLF